MDSEIKMQEGGGNENEPLAATEYADELYKFYRETEPLGLVPPNYMEGQKDLNRKMRGILIDWLIEVHHKFGLVEETLYLTVHLVDRFLAVRSIQRKKLQLVGVTALLIACKYEEVLVPVVEDLVLITAKAYSGNEVVEMEKVMLNALGFNLSLPTPYVFVKRFLKAAREDKTLKAVAFFMVDLCLVEYEMVRFLPSVLAAAAVFTARCSLRGRKDWSRENVEHTSYKENELM